MIVVSGGQTGVDRAAWDAAIELGLPTGGWVPKGRLAEDGTIDARYGGLREADSTDPAVRTRLNVRDSDATLIISRGPLTGGSMLTFREAMRLGRPVFHLDLADDSSADAVTRVRAWLQSVRPETLNVAGPRASGDPGIGELAAALLREALKC
jgi:Circularly permutated YpsA SLOG family